MKFHLVQNRKENCHHDHIPFNVKGNGSIVFSAVWGLIMAEIATRIEATRNLVTQRPNPISGRCKPAPAKSPTIFLLFFSIHSCIVFGIFMLHYYRSVFFYNWCELFLLNLFSFWCIVCRVFSIMHLFLPGCNRISGPHLLVYSVTGEGQIKSRCFSLWHQI